MKLKTDEMMERSRLDENHSSFSSAEKIFGTEAEAARVFGIVKSELLDVEEWNEHAMLAEFALFDENGDSRASNKFVVGAFLRIKLAGTFKYDWVRVEDIYEAESELVITVRPTFDPTAENQDKTAISHFFTDESTNNFCLVKRASAVAMCVIGLNEKMNAEQTSGALETMRNAAVNLGSYLGVQNSEWEKFCHHFMDDFASGKSV